MNQFYKLAIALLFANASFGQFSENFDSSSTLPAGWVAYSGTNGLGVNESWGVSTTNYHSTTNGAHVHYENVSGGMAEDWLVTPLINLSNYSGCSLTFYGAESYPSMNYGNSYSVRVSTTSQTNIGSFTTLATYSEPDFGYAKPMTNQKTVDLSSYNGQQIYVAFVMTQDDGDNWSIDDINISGTLSNETFGNQNIIKVYPNPVKDKLQITAQEEIENLQLISITGTVIKQVQNTTVLDMNELASGVYFLKITTKDNTVSTRKIVKQ
ncbi:choice-of-anchor J domain-containing protein [Flavobacterium enshiense]|uniref:T9SS-dependent choice-of-anchor J family protein n=1 Tax=Flavobacterium enshiense TaxID=1341165 RepID=UPI00345CF887